MAYAATITAFGMQSGTDSTLYVTWSWPPSGFSYISGTTTVAGAVEYYPTPVPSRVHGYDPVSIIDNLKAAGESNVSLAHRQQIAVLNGFVDYEYQWRGKGAQNGQMLRALKSGTLIRSKSGSYTTSTYSSVPNTDHYEVEWQYNLDNIWYTLSESNVKCQYSTANLINNPYITEYRVRIKPVSATYQSNGNTVSYWTADWTAWKSYKPPYRKPATPPTPNVTLTATVQNNSIVANVTGITDKLSEYIRFELFVNEDTSNKAAATSPRIKVGTAAASYTFKNLKKSTAYVVRAISSYAYQRVVGGTKRTYYTDGDPSGYSSKVVTYPEYQPAPNVVLSSVKNDASTAIVEIKWKKDATASKYTVQATYDKSYFNDNNSSGIQSKDFTSVWSDEPRPFEITLGGHQYWYFRIITTNTNNQQAIPVLEEHYTKLNIGVKPEAPTTWTLTSTFGTTSPITFYWVHNSVDSSWETKAELKLTFANGQSTTYTITDPARDPSLVEEPTHEKSITLNSTQIGYLSSGTEVKWQVRTKGVYGENVEATGWSDWSVVRAINVYARPTMVVDFTDGRDNHLQTTHAAAAYPLTVSGTVTAAGQEFVGYDVSIVSAEDYEIIDTTGHKISVTEGSTVYHRHFNTANNVSTFNTQILPGDVLLQNGINYTLNVTAACDSGLTAENNIEFYVNWDSLENYIPTASIHFDEENICTVISPMCMSLVSDPEYEEIYWDVAQTSESIAYDNEHGYSTTITVTQPSHYEVTTSKPADWATDYMFYCTKSGNKYTPVSGNTAPTWAANTYYVFVPDDQQFTIQTTSDSVVLGVLDVTAENAKSLCNMSMLQLGTDLSITEVTDSYELTTSEPDDWNELYFQYFILVNENYQAVPEADEAPEWAVNTYYRYVPATTTYYGDAIARFKVYDASSRLLANDTYPIPIFNNSATAINLSQYEKLVSRIIFTVELKNLTGTIPLNFRFTGGVKQSDTLAANVNMSIYRIAYDGELVEIAVDVPNEKQTAIRDPHPPLDYAKYRIVATDVESGTISYTDIAPQYIGYTNIVLQWNESWSSTNAESDASGTATDFYSGERITLPWNIQVSESNDMDVTLVNYAGRKNPVSYYGTRTGQSGSWSTAIPKTDTDTLYALRRLAIYPGDVYVREPSGVGYWARVAVSLSENYSDQSVPITIAVTRVEGGI